MSQPKEEEKAKEQTMARQRSWKMRQKNNGQSSGEERSEIVKQGKERLSKGAKEQTKCRAEELKRDAQKTIPKELWTEMKKDLNPKKWCEEKLGAKISGKERVILWVEERQGVQKQSEEKHGKNIMK